MADLSRRDVRDFGALPGTANAPATRAAIQAAIDSFPPLLPDQRGEVYVPGGPAWFCDRVGLDLDRPFVGLVGDGAKRSRIESIVRADGPLVRLGMPRLATPSAAHWPDAFGLLDAKAAPSPGSRFGLDLCGDSHLVFLGGPLPRGQRDASGKSDWWGRTSAFTVEFAVDGAVPPCGLFGASSHGAGDPFALVSTPDGFFVYWSCPDGTLTGAKKFTARFPALTGLAPGLHRGVVQVDLAARTVGFALDGTWQAERGDSGAAMRSAGVSTLRAWQGNPWMVGLSGGCSTATGPDFWTGTAYPKLRLFGLRVSAAPLYAPDAAGQAVRRLDGRPTTDLDGFTLGPKAVAFLAGDGPGPVPSARSVTLASPVGYAAGRLVEKAHADTFKAVRGCFLEDLTLASNQLGGDALTVGLATDFTADRCRFLGADHGLATPYWGVAYPLWFDRCEFTGDVPIHAWQAMLRLSRPSFPAPVGRGVIWAAMCDLRVLDADVLGQGTPETLYRGTLGTSARFDRIDADIESQGFPTHSVFYAETAPDRGFMSGSLVIDGANLGAPNRALCVVDLVDGLHDPKRSGFLDLRGHWDVAGPFPALVQCDGGWRGSVATRPFSFPTTIGAGAAGVAVASSP